MLLPRAEGHSGWRAAAPPASALALAPQPIPAKGLDRVLAQGRRLQELISDLLLLASLERPCDEAQKQVCDLAEITTDVLEDFGESAAAAHISLIQTSWLPAGRVLGLESELSRLVINLLSNAIQHSPSGGQIDIGLKRDGRAVRLSISDSGPGIAIDAQQRIFDRFTRLDPSRSRSHGGSGLGLAIAQAIARRHQTQIEVQSQPGSGSCFSVAIESVD